MRLNGEIKSKHPVNDKDRHLGITWMSNENLKILSYLKCYVFHIDYHLSVSLKIILRHRTLGWTNIL